MPERILLQSGDTELTPNEGYTAGSQSIQFGGVALRLACAEVRALFLDHAASRFGYSRDALTVRDGSIMLRGETTGQDYWSLARAVDLARDATGRVAPKPVADYRVVGKNALRVDLAAKVFGEAIFMHDMALDGMLHARVVRQPRRGAARRSRRSTTQRSAAPPRARSRSFATAISSRSSAPTRPMSRRPPASRRAMSRGTMSRR